MRSAADLQSDLRVVEEYAVQLTDLVSSMMAQVSEGGGLANFPNDDSLELKLQNLNLTLWRLRWQLGTYPGEVRTDPAPAIERAQKAGAA